MRRLYISIIMCTSCLHGINASTVDSLANRGFNIHRKTQYVVPSVRGDVFLNSPEVDVAKALYGKIPGLNVKQVNGNDAENWASLSIHGYTPLIMVDGVERRLDELVGLDIESCSVLKDAVASALYGVKGANGVVIITTKRGNIGKLAVTASYQMGMATQYRTPDFVDAATYANSFNTARVLDGLDVRYSPLEIKAFQEGNYPYHFPNVNWWNKTNNKLAFNHRLNFTFRGGSEKVRYYSVIDYTFNRDFLKKNKEQKLYNSKPSDTYLHVKTNLDIDLTPTTFMQLGLSANLKEKNRANVENFYSVLYDIPASAFPIRYHNGIYGGSTLHGAKNPVALLMDTGNNRLLQTSLLSNMQITQNLDFITHGLSASAALAFDYIGSMNDMTSKQYRYVDPQAFIYPDGSMKAQPLIFGKDSEVSEHKHGFKSLYTYSNFNAALNYSHDFELSNMNATLQYEQNALIVNGRNKSTKRQSVLLTAGYNFADRYAINGVLNYSGTAYLPKNDRFNLFYGVNIGWTISNESFFKNIEYINNLKLFASHGLSGSDGRMLHELYLQSYGDTGAGGYVYTNNFTSQGGQAEGILPVVGLTVEKNRKTTLGMEMDAFNNRLHLYGEAFWDRRKDILVSGENTVSSIIGIAPNLENAGIEEYKGLDFGLSWNEQRKNWKYGVYANGSFMTSKLINENQAFQQYDYLYHAGNPVGQMYGLEAIGFFSDQQDINNSPIQKYSTVKPGDLKYKDQNGDNKIDDLDVVKMYGSNLPKFYFGFGVNVSYKNLSLSADFQGVTGKTVNLLDCPLYKPLINNSNLSSALMKEETPWTPEQINSATLPRLTTIENKNNYQPNSLWYRDGSFIKLRNLKLSYALSKSVVRFADMVIYLQGTNLLSLDNLHIVDPENINATYPTTRVYWIGMNMSF